MLTFNSLLSIIVLVDRAVLLLVVYYIFLIYIDENLELSSFLMLQLY